MPMLEQLSDEDLAQIAGVQLKGPGGGVLLSPVSGVVGSGFDDDRAGGRKHRSGDVAAPAGTPVVAPGNMRFLYGGQGGTNLQSNDWWAHFEDTESEVQYRMAHVGDISHLAPGQEFRRGEPVAVVGDAIKGTHLHMSVVDPNGEHVDWLSQAGLQRGSRVEAGGELQGRGILARVGDWLGPSPAEAAGPGKKLEEMSDEELAKIAGVKLDDLSDDELARVAGVQLAPRQGSQAGTPAPLEPPTSEEYMQSVQGLDLGAGFAPPAPGRRPPGIYDEGPITERNLLDTVKDYLGYRDLPAFLPSFNKETGLWQAQDVYEARKLFHSWQEPTEVERVMYHGVISPLTLGFADVIAKDRFGPVPAPETVGGAVAAGALSFGGFMVQPFNLAEGLLGTRLAPTRTGLRGIVQLMTQGGASLGLATSLSSLAPSLANNDRLTEAGLEFVKGTTSGALIGVLFPVAGVIPTKALRMAMGLAALDFVKTRFHAAPDQGWFTVDDVYRGVMDGSIDRKVLAQKTQEYLMDLYFLGKTPSMKKQLEGLRYNAMLEEAAKVSAHEAEDALVEIGKSGVLKPGFQWPPKYSQFPLTESPQYAAEFAKQLRKLAPEITDEQAAGLLAEKPGLAGAVQEGWVEAVKIQEMLSKLPGESPPPEPSPASVEGEQGVQAGKPAPLTPAPLAEGERWRKPFELNEEEYGARMRALKGEGRFGQERPDPTAAKLAKLREADVRHALKRGETVPPEVLADFPELAARVGRELPAAAAQEKELPTDALPEHVQRAIHESSMGRRTNEGGSIEAPDPYAGGRWVQREVPLSEITSNPRNKSEPDAYKGRKSVTEGPIVIDDRGEVIDGNHRVNEALLRGDKLVSAYVFEPPEPKASVKAPGEATKGPYEEALDKQRELLKAVEAKIGRAKTDKSKDKLENQKSVIQSEIQRLEEAKLIDEANQKRIRQEMAAKGTQAKQPEAPDYAYIEQGDLVQDAKNPEVRGPVLREVVQGEGKEALKGFVVDQEGQERFIGRDDAKLMGLEERERLVGETSPSPQPSPAGGEGDQGVQDGKPAPLQGEAGETPALQKMYGFPGMDTQDIVAYGRQLEGLGKRMIDWIDVRLESSLPPHMRDPDVSKFIGTLLLKFQQFEDIARTYPEAKPTFDAARAGLVLKTRYASEAYSLLAPYESRLNPEERARVDKVLLKLDDLNQPDLGREFRLGDDIDRWQSYLLNPREDIREKGIAFYQRHGGLSAREAEGAFGVRMALDYFKALQMDFHSRTFQKWLESHGFDRGKVKDILDWTLNTEMDPYEIAKAYFGPDPGKNVVTSLEHYRKTMHYWQKETHQYIPHARFGEFFIRVIDTGQAAKVKDAYQKTLEAIDRRYPKDKVDIKATLEQQSLEFMQGEDAAAGETPALRPLTKADRMRNEAREVFQDAMKGTVIHAAAAETRAQYHEKRAALEAEFPAAEGFLIKDHLNTQLPMEFYSESDIPRLWKIVRAAAEEGRMSEVAGEAMIQGWQDQLAAKGAGAHYIKRWNVPGFETDLQRPLASYLSGVAGYLGKAEKVRGFSEAFQQVPKEMPRLLSHLNKYADYQLTNAPEWEGARNVIYNWTMGGNLSFHFINALQNISTGWAVLGSAGKAPLKQLSGAYKDWGTYMAKGEGLRPGEEAALARARYEPELAPSMVSELSGRAYNPLYRWMHNDPTSLSAKAMDVFKGFWGGAFVEQMNRETFFLAAYRTTGDFDQSIVLVRQAHFLYGKETRPAIIRGPLGSLAGLFMTYMGNYLTLYKNFSKAALGYNPEVYGDKVQGVQGLTRMLAGAAITGGLMGTGLYPIFSKAYQMVYGSNLEEDGKDYLQEAFGASRGVSERIVRGAVGGLPAMALNIDIGSRIAPNLPGMNLSGGELTWEKMVAAGLGAGSIPLQAAFGVYRALQQGQPRRALEAGAPTSVRNLLQAHRLATEGATTMKGQPIFTAQGEPLVLDAGETAWKAAGFQPIRLAEHQRKASFARKMEADRRDTAQGFAGDLARAIKNEDEAGFNATIDAWVAHNNKMIEAGRYADIIEAKSVEQAVKMRFKPQYPDVSQKKMILRDMNRPSLADTLSPESTD